MPRAPCLTSLAVAVVWRQEQRVRVAMRSEELRLRKRAAQKVAEFQGQLQVTSGVVIPSPTHVTMQNSVRDLVRVEAS